MTIAVTSSPLVYSPGVTAVPQAGRDEAFTAFVALRYSALLRTALLLTGEHAAAEDLVQSALAKTYVAWDRIRDAGAREAYVRRTMVTTNISHWRSPWRRRERQVAEVPESPGAPAPDHYAERSALWPHLKALPRGQRAVIVLRYYEDLSEAQIASMLGCSVGTVKSQASRALATLRARMQPAEPAGQGHDSGSLAMEGGGDKR